MNTLKFEERLAREYKYKKLPEDVSNECRELYKRNIPSFLSTTGGGALYTTFGTLITNNYNRIVIGDYGAFIEFDTPNMEAIQTQFG